MLYAICYMLYAICSGLYAICYMLYAICYTLYLRRGPEHMFPKNERVKDSQKILDLLSSRTFDTRSLLPVAATSPYNCTKCEHY